MIFEVVSKKEFEYPLEKQAIGHNAQGQPEHTKKEEQPNQANLSGYEFSVRYFLDEAFQYQSDRTYNLKRKKYLVSPQLKKFLFCFFSSVSNF